jgi:rRNA pseudouridine-1189 N-methylase Emg1 (Nep1/Mra1 family)
MADNETVTAMLEKKVPDIVNEYNKVAIMFNKNYTALVSNLLKQTQNNP